MGGRGRPGDLASLDLSAHWETSRHSERERERAGSCQECSRSVREPVSVLHLLRDMEKEKFSTAMARSVDFSSQGLTRIMDYVWIKTSEHARF